MAPSDPLDNDRLRRLERLRMLARLMDSQFTIPGIKVQVGWDGVVGLIPGIGDLVTTGVSLYIIAEARKLGASKWILTRMVGNVAIDAVVGAAPVLGDLFDVAFKANLRNLRLLGIEPRKPDADRGASANAGAARPSHR